MNSPLKRIVLPLLFIILLPAVAYSVYEFSSLNETEKVIEEIYTNQLDVILNSVNQYSDLTVAAWSSKVGFALENDDYNFSWLSHTDFQQLLNANSSLNQIVLIDSLSFGKYKVINNKKWTAIDVVKEVVKENEAKLKRLYSYYDQGYKKIEPLVFSSTESQFLASLLSDGSNKVLVIFEVDPDLFIEQILRQPILEAAGEEFAIACFSQNDLHEFNFEEEVDTADFNVTNSLWLLPEYKIGIILKGRTLGGLIAERTYTNLILIFLTNVIMISGVIIVYRNIKKEIEFARIKSDFVSNVSHELRTPLALISMYAETLEMGRVKTEEKKESYYRIISGESNRLSKIVNSILSFSKIEAGKRKYNLSETSINDVVSNIYESYNYHLTSLGFMFNINLEKDLAEIKIDREAVSESLINLLDNAAKYSRDDKYICLSTGIKNNRVFVEVEDHGIGISKVNQKKVFEKFFRVSTGLIHDTKGTGLGLTIVKHVMDAHKAEIEIESEPGKGSIFRLLFQVSEV